MRLNVFTYFSNSLRIACLAALCGALFGQLSQQASAVELLNDTFTYPDGNLVGNGGWTAVSGAGETPVQVQTGQVFLTQFNFPNISEEDVSNPLSETQTAGQTFYYGFDVVVNQLPDLGGVSQSYFAHFVAPGDVGGSLNFVARTFVGSPNVTDPTKFTFGLRTENGSSPVKFTEDYTLGTTYRVVAAYDFDSGDSTLWIDPTSMASSSITEANMSIDVAVDNSGFAINAFNFRQGGSSGDTTQTIDNLIVATTFEEALGGGGPMFTLGDTNNDGTVDTLDIDPFVLLLTDPAGYAAAFPGVDSLAVGDINMDTVVDTLDIDPFVALLTSGSLTGAGSVPEPSSVALVVLATVALVGFRRRVS